MLTYTLIIALIQSNEYITENLQPHW